MTDGRPTILAINPGSTSTKLSLFVDEEERYERTVRHSVEDLAGYSRVGEQAGFRTAAVRDFISVNGIALSTLDAVIGRGGLLHPLASGVYAVNDEMVNDLLAARYGEHASNLGGPIARSIATEAGCPAFIADPVVVDELDDVARLSGVPELPRRSIFHALNQKSAAREACRRRSLEYASSSLIVAHMGGGCSVGAHRNGRVIDVNNALDGEGPFSPERAGTVPAGQLVEMALSGTHDRAALKRILTGAGGLVAYCRTNDLMEISRRIDSGDAEADLVFRAMAYQISQEIARHGATLSGRVDAIVLTGGMAYHEALVSMVSGRVGYLAPIEVIPGEREMVSLARAARAACEGCEPVQEYRAWTTTD